MAENQGQTPTTPETPATPNANGQTPAAAEGQQQEGQGQEPERFDAEYVRSLRKEAAGYRSQLRQLEQQVKTHEEQKLSETERLQKRVSELERAQSDWERDRQERTLKYEAIGHASKLGIIDPDAAYRLLDPASVEYTEDGTPKNLPALLQALVRERPYLAGPKRVGSADAGAGVGTVAGDGQQDMNTLIRRAAGRAT